MNRTFVGEGEGGCLHSSCRGWGPLGLRLIRGLPLLLFCALMNNPTSAGPRPSHPPGGTPAPQPSEAMLLGQGKRQKSAPALWWDDSMRLSQLMATNLGTLLVTSAELLCLSLGWSSPTIFTEGLGSTPAPRCILSISAGELIAEWSCVGRGCLLQDLTPTSRNLLRKSSEIGGQLGTFWLSPEMWKGSPRQAKRVE